MGEVTLRCGIRQMSWDRNELCILSPYFKAMFESSMKESVESEVDLYFLEEEIFVALFCNRNHTMVINEENVAGLLQASDFFGLDDWMKDCNVYLKKSLDETNCLRIFLLVEQFQNRKECVHLYKIIKCFIRRNFERAVFHCVNDVHRVLNPDFLMLSCENLMMFLESDYLHISSELLLLEAVHQWINFDIGNRGIYIHELVKLLQLDGISQYTDNTEDLSSCLSCQNVRQQASLRHRRKLTQPTAVTIEEFQKISSKEMIQWSVIQGRKRGRIGGKESLRLSITANENGVFVIDPHKDIFLHWEFFKTSSREAEWTTISSSPLKVVFPGTAIMGGECYIAGGMDATFHPCSSVCKYDGLNQQWWQIADMIQPRESFGMAAVGDYLYALGGSIKKNGVWHDIEFAERYNRTSKSWSSIPPMLSKRCAAAVAVVNEYIFVIGGYNGSYPLRSMECLDTRTLEWQKCADMTKGRDTIGVAVVGKYIYAVGGNLGEDATDSVERYDTEDNTWTPISYMKALKDDVQVIIW